jgi:hypothetical protein
MKLIARSICSSDNIISAAVKSSRLTPTVNVDAGVASLTVASVLLESGEARWTWNAGVPRNSGKSRETV